MLASFNNYGALKIFNLSETLWNSNYHFHTYVIELCENEVRLYMLKACLATRWMHLKLSINGNICLSLGPPSQVSLPLKNIFYATRGLAKSRREQHGLGLQL